MGKHHDYDCKEDDLLDFIVSKYLNDDIYCRYETYFFLSPEQKVCLTIPEAKGLGCLLKDNTAEDNHKYTYCFFYPENKDLEVEKIIEEVAEVDEIFYLTYDEKDVAVSSVQNYLTALINKLNDRVFN